jgi:hypothetical protein
MEDSSVTFQCERWEHSTYSIENHVRSIFPCKNESKGRLVARRRRKVVGESVCVSVNAQEGALSAIIANYVNIAYYPYL